MPNDAPQLADDWGPIGDYVAATIEQAVRAERIRVARECERIAATFTDPKDCEYSRLDTEAVRADIAQAIRSAFPEAFEGPQPPAANR